MDNQERRDMLVKELDLGSLEHADRAFFANMLGYTTADFLSVMQNVPGFPDAVRDLKGVTPLYPVVDAVKALLAHYEAALRVETPLPRGAGADAPQSTLADGEMALHYTEQNFNSLVAANTAMETELSAMTERLAEKDAIIASEKARRNDVFISLSAERARAEERGADLNAMKEKLGETEIERDYFRDNAASLQRKLDRSLGYLDRVIDDQESFRDPEKRAVSPPPVGPDLGAIPEARRRSRNMEAMFPGEPIRMMDSSERRRRY